MEAQGSFAGGLKGFVEVPIGLPFHPGCKAGIGGAPDESARIEISAEGCSSLEENVSKRGNDERECEESINDEHDVECHPSIVEWSEELSSVDGEAID